MTALSLRDARIKQYNLGVTCLEQAQYAEALDVFSSLGSFAFLPLVLVGRARKKAVYPLAFIPAAAAAGIAATIFVYYLMFFINF